MHRELARGISAGLLLFVLATTAVGASAPVPSALHAGDRAALVALYSTTDGPRWSNDANWLTDRPLDAWYGVTTGDDGRVTGLDLHGNELRGQIPPELEGLSSLIRLRLSDNSLSGQIPPGLSGLSNLTDLFLQGNRTFTCPLDDAAFREWLKGIWNQKGLSCWYHEDRAALVALYHATGGLNWAYDTHWLSDLPLEGWYGVTTNEEGRVTKVVLAGNELNGQIPPELGNLSRLQHLDLHDNELRGRIPPELEGLSSLIHLRLSGNSLSGQIPPELGSLFHLRHLLLDGNDLDGQIPPELGKLSNLVILRLNDNDLSGQIPPGLSGLSNLTDLFLQGNRTFTCPLDDAAFREWLKGIWNQKGLSCWYHEDRAALVALYHTTDGPNWAYDANWLTDRPLDAWYGVTTNDEGRVTALFLRGNELSGPIPPELSRLSELVLLDLSNNHLGGQLPTELSRLNRLSHLFLQGNRTFMCPLDDGAFREWLNGIRKRGRFCTHAGDRAALVALYHATGGPNWRRNTHWLSDWHVDAWQGVNTNDEGRVIDLVLHDNWLSGQIPPELGDLSGLQSLHLSNNRLSGRMPPELGSLVNLRLLFIDGNELSGRIPSELANLSKLTQLNLRHNELNGEIPSELASLSNLTHLNLSHNELDGPLSADLASLSNLIYLNLFHNQLSGRIPAELANLSKLAQLNLRHNELSGQIPLELASLSKLTYLNLSHNELIGPLPAELASSASLRQLVLDSNELSGRIPPEFGDLKNWEVLSLDGNRLIEEDSFQRFPASPWEIPWGGITWVSPWDIDWLDIVRATGRLVIMPALVLGLFALVDPPGARRTWDWNGERVGRQRRLRGLPFP